MSDSRDKQSVSDLYRASLNSARARICATVVCLNASANTVIALFTIVLAGVAIASLIDAKDALEAGTRAWVVPTGARIDGAVASGVPLRIKVSFENTGKEAALNTLHVLGLSQAFEVKPDGAGIPYIDVHNAPWPPRFDCTADISKPETGRPVYPGAKYEDIRYVFGGGPSQAFLEKRESFVMVGCFIYKSFKRVRRSSYCLYWQPHRDRPIEQSTLEFCPIGNGPAD